MSDACFGFESEAQVLQGVVILVQTFVTMLPSLMEAWQNLAAFAFAISMQLRNSVPPVRPLRRWPATGAALTPGASLSLLDRRSMLIAEGVSTRDQLKARSWAIRLGSCSVLCLPPSRTPNPWRLHDGVARTRALSH